MRISFNGVDLGEFEESQIPALIKSATIDHTAFYWREGMTDWLPISDLPILAPFPDTEQPPEALEALEALEAPQEAPKKKTKDSPTKTQTNFLAKRNVPFEALTKTEAQILIDDLRNKEQEEKDRKKIEREQSKAEQERIRNIPTAKQLAYLDYHCVSYTPDITKAGATELISVTIKKYPDSDWSQVKHNIRPDLYDYFEREGAAKSEYDFFVAELARIQSDSASTEEDIQTAKDDVKDAKEEIQAEKEMLADELEDWVYSFDEGEFANTGEDISEFMQAFKKPSKSQVKAIRDRFEKHYKIHFDEVTKEQFFLVYKKLFPACIKKGKRADFSVDDIIFSSTYSKVKKGKPPKLPLDKTKGGSCATIVKGCLILLFIIVGLILIGLILGFF